MATVLVTETDAGQASVNERGSFSRLCLVGALFLVPIDFPNVFTGIWSGRVNLNHEPRDPELSDHVDVVTRWCSAQLAPAAMP
jgi:hypothetical protein